jgi:hypothetical protein
MKRAIMLSSSSILVALTSPSHAEVVCPTGATPPTVTAAAPPQDVHYKIDEPGVFLQMPVTVAFHDKLTAVGMSWYGGLTIDGEKMGAVGDCSAMVNPTELRKYYPTYSCRMDLSVQAGQFSHPGVYTGAFTGTYRFFPIPKGTTGSGCESSDQTFSSPIKVIVDFDVANISMKLDGWEDSLEGEPGKDTPYFLAFDSPISIPAHLQIWANLGVEPYPDSQAIQIFYTNFLREPPNFSRADGLLRLNKVKFNFHPDKPKEYKLNFVLTYKICTGIGRCGPEKKFVLPVYADATGGKAKQQIKLPLAKPLRNKAPPPIVPHL